MEEVYMYYEARPTTLAEQEMAYAGIPSDMWAAVLDAFNRTAGNIPFQDFVRVVAYHLPKAFATDDSVFWYVEGAAWPVTETEDPPPKKMVFNPPTSDRLPRFIMSYSPVVMRHANYQHRPKSRSYRRGKD